LLFGVLIGFDRSVGASECWLPLPDCGLGDGVCELVAADEREDRRDHVRPDRAKHQERGLEAAGECRGYGVAGVKQRLGVTGRRDRDPDRAAELLRRVQGLGREPGLVLGNTGERGGRDLTVAFVVLSVSWS